jgi:cation:H+ antiporter
MVVATFLAGLALLLAGAEVLVRGASRFALAIGVSPLVVGLTVVAYATSAPELVVSASAACKGSAGLAVGNVIGSNLFNSLFILGLSACVVPLTVSKRLIRIDVPLMAGLSLLVFLFAMDGRIYWWESTALLICGVSYSVAMVVVARRQNRDVCVGGTENREQACGARETTRSVFFVVAGVSMLILGGQWLVVGAVAFAKSLGLSEAVIGLTIVAAGTGLPEAATSVVAGLRGQRDIAIGNVLGSNIFNLTFALGAAGVAGNGALPVSNQILLFDVPVLLISALVCWPVFRTGYTIRRWEGAVFLLSYVLYIGALVHNVLFEGTPERGLIETGLIALPLMAAAVVVPAMQGPGRR